MPVTLGRPRASQEIEDLLLECHDRIRAFTALAVRLADAAGAAPEEVADTAAKVARYFSTALPLHARDEEESLLPRLRGADPAVDRELATMHAEHEDHGPLLARLVSACEGIARDPRLLGELAPGLREVAGALERHFAEHLRREEETIFPALARLDRDARAEMVTELRARRR